MAGKEIKWDPIAEQYVEVGKRGRPKGSGFVGAAIKALTVGDRKKGLPEEIVVSVNAPYEVMVIAAFQNLLNGWPMTPLVEQELAHRRIDAQTVANDRQLWAGQLHLIMDEYIESLAQRHDNMGNYVPQYTTAGQGTVMSSMTGAHDKRGKLRE